MVKPVAWVRICLVLLVVSIIGACTSHPPVNPGVIGDSPAVRDILPQDPALVTGRLANGFRYVFLVNKTPESRVSMHLDVQAGSMDETDQELGVAHFLEHMVFNGSTHFKPGELVEYFQSIGMQFGPDANAHTSFFETVYDVLLPHGDRKSMEKGMVVLDDYARGALLSQDEVNRERGVILAEKRDRDSVSYRTFARTLAFELPGSRIPQRLPIGDEKVIQAADSSLLRGFYGRCYRPDRLLLVLVGDFDPDIARELAEKQFSQMGSNNEKQAVPDNMLIAHQGTKPFYHYEPEAGKTDVTIETVIQKEVAENTRSALEEKVKRQLAEGMVQHRLDRILRSPGSSFSDAGIFSGQFLKDIQFATITAESSPERWAETLSLLEKTLRQALEYGFAESEFSRVKADFVNSLDTAVKEASTRKSTNLAREIITTINRGGVFQSPTQEQDLLKPFVMGLTLEDVLTAFREIWSAGHRLVLVTGNEALADSGQTPESRIERVFAASQNQTVAAYAADDEAVFPYLPEPSGEGRIVSRETVPDLGVSVIDFENHVRLNVKQTDYKKGEFSVRITFGDGRKGEPASMPGLSSVGASVINESGLGKLDKSQLEQALAGKTVSLTFAVDEDQFVFSGDCDPDEVKTLFQLARTFFLDPGFRVDALDLARTRYGQMYQTLLRTPEGMLKLRGEKFLASGDTRFGLPDMSSVETVSLDNVKEWLLPYFNNSPIEVSVVGDVEPDRVVKAVGRYLGTLPDRALAKTDAQNRIPVFPEGKSLVLGMDTKIDKTFIDLGFPTDDFWDISRTRRLNILASILSERMRLVVREKLGAAYSPFAYNEPSRAYEGYGVLHMVVSVAPNEVDAVSGAMYAIVQDLVSKGVGQKELELALEPVLTHLKDVRRTNSYWLNSVLSGSWKHPESFDWSRKMQDDYASISRGEITRLALQYLKRDHSAIIVVKPR
ncbi:MAG: insulinase family protein [Pseudomonadota bacterium]